MSLAQKALRRIEVRHDGEVYANRPPTKWGNRDVFPVPIEQQRFTAVSFLSFWVIFSMSVTSWAYGGSILELGLSIGEGVGCIVVASLFVALFGYLCGDPGAFMHLGFTAMARATFGLYGAYLPVLLLVFENVVFFGIHGYFGGIAAVIVISAMSSSFKNMKNTLPESAGITSQNLIGFVVYIVVFLILLLTVHPSKMRIWVWPAACCVAVCFFGILGWAISANHGSPGHLLAPEVHISSTQRSWAMVYAITSAAGSTTAFSVRFSDWTRFSKTRHAPVPSLIAGAPTFGCLSAVFGILATSAVYSRYKVVTWNPVALLIYLQKTQYTPACRAATFFAGLGLFAGLVMNNLMGKILSAGMDTAGLFPKYITTRRGSVILVVIGVLIQPWRFVTQSSTFLTVLSSFGVFVAPLTGILVADYWLVRRRKWKVPDIFDQDGIYWYKYGVNWRAMVAFFLSFVFSMPGFVASVDNDSIAIGWTHVYQACYMINIAIAFAVFYGLSIAFPPAGLGEAEPWDTGAPNETDSARADIPVILDEKDENATQVEDLSASARV